MLFLHFRRKGLTVTKAAPKERVQWALNEFDQNLRHQPNWIGWETNRRYYSAITIDDKRYPAKKIISLALEIAECKLSGASETTLLLRKAGFSTEPIQQQAASLTDLRFELEAVYDREWEIHRPFGGNRRSGISKSARFPSIFIFTGVSGKKSGYTDRWDGNDIFLYTGEGQIGQMTLTNGNRAIAEHSKNGYSIHIFEARVKSRGHIYKGEFICENFFYEQQPDRTGALRRAIVFRLVRLCKTDNYGLDEIQDENTQFPTKPIFLNTARMSAIKAAEMAAAMPTHTAPRNVYQRSKIVARYVLMRAKGLCESCGKNAPFLKQDGSPYLEPHHINRMSDGGLDHPMYVAAICPNCHREIHSGKYGMEKNSSLALKIRKIETLETND